MSKKIIEYLIYAVIALTIFLFLLLCIMGLYKSITEDKVVAKEVKMLYILKNAAVDIDEYVESFESVIIKETLIPSSMRDHKNNRILNNFKGNVFIKKTTIEATPVIHIVSTNIHKQKCELLLFNLAYQSDKLIANNITIKELNKEVIQANISSACQQDKTTINIYYKY